jgi:hypothetical protein
VSRFVWTACNFIKLAHLDDDLMAQNNMDDVAHCGKSLQTLNENSGDQLYRYYRYRYVYPGRILEKNP